VHGDVSVHVSRFFKGFFAASAEHGTLDFETGGNKTIEILHQTVTGMGRRLWAWSILLIPKAKKVATTTRVIRRGKYLIICEYGADMIGLRRMTMK